jgi:hypothetical protein
MILHKESGWIQKEADMAYMKVFSWNLTTGSEVSYVKPQSEYEVATDSPYDNLVSHDYSPINDVDANDSYKK